MEVIRTMRARLASERGSVGVVVALVIFVVMGMLTMTWNTAQLSKTKMRPQNAADAAALSHAIWQARGMNAVQNINDEMYEALSLSVKLLTIAKVVESVAMTFEVAANIPIVGPVFKGLAIAMHTIGVLTGGSAGWMAARICKYFLKYLAIIYAKGASLFGLWNAQQLAAQNEADPLAKLDTTGSTTESDSWHFGIYTLGVSSSPMDIFMLPLEPSATTSRAKPWHQSANELSLFKNSTTPWKQIYSIMGTPDGWDVDPYVSKRGTQEGLGMSGGKVTDDSTLPTPAVWIAFKLGKNIQTLPLDGFWNANDKDRWTHKLPMFAVAAAQCITGDVVPHSNKKSGENPNNQRPAGFGAGATAKLVPVSEVFYKIKDGAGTRAGTTVDALIYH